jgi:hypothetical protein
MSITPPNEMRAGDYAKRSPKDTPDERSLSRDAMRRQGCKSIRFEVTGAGELIAHGYVGRFEGAHVEAL